MLSYAAVGCYRYCCWITGLLWITENSLVPCLINVLYCTVQSTSTGGSLAFSHICLRHWWLLLSLYLDTHKNTQVCEKIFITHTHTHTHTHTQGGQSPSGFTTEHTASYTHNYCQHTHAHNLYTEYNIYSIQCYIHIVSQWALYYYQSVLSLSLSVCLSVSHPQTQEKRKR